MSRLTIDTGTPGNPATGDSLRGAFTKVNNNFAELYAELGGDSLDAISFTNNTISTDITNANLVLTGNGTGGVVMEDIEITGSTINVLTTNSNLTLDTNGTGKVIINGLSFPTADGTAGQVLKTDGAGNLSFTAVDPGAITIVGDDSSGTAVNIGETFKIAGSGTVTTSVSGDTITITGSASAQGITFVGDDSTGTRVSDGESFKIAGTQNITTAVSGDTLTITGINTGDFAFSGNTLSTTSSNADIELDPAGTGNLILKSGNFLPTADNTQYLGSASKRWHTLYVGPGSININGVTISESAGKLNIPGGVTGTQGLASIILPVPSSLPYSGQNDNLGNPFVFANNTVFLDQHTYLYIQGKVAAGGIWAGWTVGTGYPESLGFTPATFTHTHSSGALTQLTLASGGSGLSVAATDNIMAFRNGDPITTTLASPYAGILGTVDVQGSSQDTLTTINQLTAGGTFTAQDQSLFFDNINIQTGANIVFSDSTTQNTAARITVVGDDSTGVTLNAGETIKIAGSGSITTSVSGDTLTIAGSASAQGITFVGDDSTGTRVSDGESFKITGTQNITTAVSGDTLTITGPDLSSYLTAVPKTIDVNSITSSDSSAIQINDAVNISGAVTANAGLTVPGAINGLGNSKLDFNTYGANTAYLTTTSDDTTALFMGTASAELYAQTNILIRTNTDETAKVWTFGDDGSVTFPDSTTQNTAASITIVGDDSTGTTLNAGETIKIAGAGSITTAVSGDTITITGTGGGASIGDLTVDGTTISSGSSSKITLNESVDITGTLQVNDINSADSTAIQINDSVNISGTLNAKTLITNTISSEDSSAIQINDGLRISGDLTFSNNTVQTTAYVTASGNWTVTAGTNTYSFTVPSDGTYTMWVKGNIANGIIIWNATVSVSNSNVAAIGYQYAWNYTGGGSPIALTAIPDQIRGTAGTISTDATYVGSTSNRFDFGISNSSGASQTVYYGYAKIA